LEPQVLNSSETTEADRQITIDDSVKLEPKGLSDRPAPSSPLPPPPKWAPLIEQRITRVRQRGPGVPPGALLVWYKGLIAPPVQGAYCSSGTGGLLLSWYRGLMAQLVQGAFCSSGTGGLLLVWYRGLIAQLVQGPNGSAGPGD